MTRYLPRELISTHLKSFSPRDKCSLLEYPKPCSEYWWLSQEFMKGGQACARVQTTAHIIGQSLKDGCHISNLRHPVCQSEVRNTDYKRAQVIYRVNPYSQNCRLFRHSTMWGPWKAWFTRKRGSWWAATGPGRRRERTFFSCIIGITLEDFYLQVLCEERKLFLSQ